jgi:hypothetical protein
MDVAGSGNDLFNVPSAILLERLKETAIFLSQNSLYPVGFSKASKTLRRCDNPLGLCSFKSLSQWHGASSGCGWRRRPPDMERNLDYIAKVVVDNWQGMASPAWRLGGLPALHREMDSLILNVIQVLGLDGLLWTRWWIFEFHKWLGNFWLSERLLASYEGLCCM